MMKISDMDLRGIKLAVFDFDDTLAIHKDREFMKKHFENGQESKNNYYFDAYTNPDSFYDEIEPCEKSEALYKLIMILREKGIKMYCLSGMKFSFHLKAKQAFVDKHYGKGIEVISAASQELKLQGIKILQKVDNCELCEVMFIDDRQSVIDILSENGVKGILVTDIEL